LIRMSEGTHHEFRAQPGPDFIYLGGPRIIKKMIGEQIKPGDPRG